MLPQGGTDVGGNDNGEEEGINVEDVSPRDFLFNSSSLLGGDCGITIGTGDAMGCSASIIESTEGIELEFRNL